MSPSKLSSKSRAFSRLVPAAFIALTLTACAPDAWKYNPNISAFYNRVLQHCGEMALGPVSVQMLVNQDANYATGPIFLDMLSDYDSGKLSTPAFVSAVSSAARIPEDAPVIRCITAQKNAP